MGGVCKCMVCVGVCVWVCVRVCGVSVVYVCVWGCVVCECVGVCGVFMLYYMCTRCIHIPPAPAVLPAGPQQEGLSGVAPCPPPCSA